MRTPLLGMAFMLAVLVGIGLGQAGLGLGLGAAFGWACVVMAAGWLVERREASGTAGTTLALVGLLVCAGLARGAGVARPPGPRAVERGVGPAVELREFEVVGASEPGPGCRLELRDPRATRSSPSFAVEAPAEDCPRSQGQRVAVMARALRPTWRSALLERERIRLGRAPVLWARPVPPRTRGQRLVDRYWAEVAALRQRAWQTSRGDPASSLVVAAALGLRSALEPELRSVLRAAGLGHLIAVSGLHVALAALWFTALARRVVAMLGVSPHFASVGAWLPLWAYVGLTGGAPSAIRAAAMLTALELGAVVGRPSHGPTSLVLVAGLMLFVEPRWALDPGFALSVAAMAAIVSAERGLGVLALSWRISWATAPLSLLFFDHAPLHGLIGNLVALPVFALMMPLGLVACLASGGLAGVAMVGARCFAGPILDVAELLASVPSLGAAGLALVALVLRGLAWSMPDLGESDDAMARSSWLVSGWRRGWVPPKLAAWALVGVALALELSTARATPARAQFEWVAVGTPRSYSVLSVDTAAPGAACLHRPTASAGTWIALFEQLGVDRLSRLDAQLPPTLDRSASAEHPPRSDPRTRALAEALWAAGVGVGPGWGSACTPVDRAELRAALATCRFIQGRPEPALVRAWRGRLECRVEDRWVQASP